MNYRPGKDSTGVFNSSLLGSMLFYNCVSGARVLSESAPGKTTTINGHTFINWGSHTNAYPCLPYITAACAIGMTIEEIDSFIKTFKKLLRKAGLKADKQIVSSSPATVDISTPEHISSLSAAADLSALEHI